MDVAIETVADGSGPTVLVVQGGPGFSHSYLSGPVAEAMHGQRVVALRPAAGREGSVSFKSSIEHLKSAVAVLSQNGPLCVVAHSWGCLSLLAALDEARELWPKIVGGVLINPVALQRKSFDAVARGFQRRIPIAVKLAILYQALLRKDGEAVVELLLPSYGVPSDVAKKQKIGLDLVAYNAVMRSAGPFTVSADRNLLSRFSIIRGSDDITPADKIGALLAAVHATIDIPAGHFPMIAAPARFSEALQNFAG